MLLAHTSLDETIAACATAPGAGGIAIVRISGKMARQIGRTLAPRRGEATSHQMRYCRIRNQKGETLDHGMVVEMHAPKSYTGEDVVELHLHGAPTVVQAVIECCLRLGARLAQPGEFTLRAFLNGRMDLAQAEAVLELIASHNEAQRKVAAAHLQGDLSIKIVEIIEHLESVLVAWQASLDFPEQIVGQGDTPEQWSEVERQRCKIQSVLENSRPDWFEPRRLVLCGAPNSGKSTLLNVLCGQERVLVDAEPGTTRDPIEVEMAGSAVRWSVLDTAGIRSDAVGVEARGIEMTRQRVHTANLALWLVAADVVAWPEPELTAEVVGSKSDLADRRQKAEVEAEAQRRHMQFWGWVSGKTGEGVEALRTKVMAHWSADSQGSEAMVVRGRHIEALRQASEALDRAIAGRGERTLDVLAMDVEEATVVLGTIVGRNVDVEVLDKIFAEFCLGK
jgi:tRNA modification GTPase